MDDATLHPEIIRPYDARRNPLPAPTQDICDSPVFNICVNEFWWAHISGQIGRLLYRDAWDGTDDDIDRAIASISKILDVGRPTMGCGCTETTIPLSRIDENGHYQQSDDGGATWHDAPQSDPRNTVPRLPPSPPTSTDNAKCAYADSVVDHFKEGFIDILEEGQTAEEIGGLFTSAAELIFGPLTGPIGWIIPAIFAIATAVVAIGITAVTNAFTPTFWNALRCLIFDNMNADGSFTQAQLDVIYSNVPGGAITTVIIDSWIAAIGTTGMTNAAHIAKGSTSADCGSCSSSAEVFVWDELADESTQLVPDEDGIYTAPSGTATSGGYYVCSVFFQSALPVPEHWDCWQIDTLSNPTGSDPVIYRCSDYSLDPLASCPAQYTWRSNSAPFSIQFSIGDHCGEE